MDIDSSSVGTNAVDSICSLLALFTSNRTGEAVSVRNSIVASHPSLPPHSLQRRPSRLKALTSKWIEGKRHSGDFLGLPHCVHPCSNSSVLSRHGDWISHRTKIYDGSYKFPPKLLRLTKAPLRLFKRGSNGGINLNRGL